MSTHEPRTLSTRNLTISGQVQGVGFRPFVYSLANKHQLSGWVRNGLGLVEMHIQGNQLNIQQFVDELINNKPDLARPVIQSNTLVEAEEYTGFEIKNSRHHGIRRISIPQDMGICNDCLQELYDPNDRRYRYPFNNCTQCGPRYSLINALPYDRTHTSMAEFDLCPTCEKEYITPDNRRYHAEPIACPQCGPSLSLKINNELICGDDNVLARAVALLKAGNIIAVKGIGGYHLMCDARNNDAVKLLRQRKNRPHKPLAVMYPCPANQGAHMIDQDILLTVDEKDFLQQAARPLLLAARKNTCSLSEHIAPGLNEIGVMYPYSPLHHLLLNDFSAPLVATSANISGEPVLTDNTEVEQRLINIADAFLHHNRDIVRPADDPVFRTVLGKPHPIRLGRGFAPTELTLPFKLDIPTLAVGAHMKNTACLAWDDRAVISPHIGDMATLRSLETFKHCVSDLQKLYGVEAQQLVHDAHPGYTTSRWANDQNIPSGAVLHHHAHASAAWYECQATEDVIAFSWDGLGMGNDKTLWGGETFIGHPGNWQRLASLCPFKLCGGDKVSHEPWRSAAGLCWQAELEYNDIPQQGMLHKQAWQQDINTVISSSAGRLFDAAAALTGTCTHVSFDGQGPMLLESLAYHTCDYIEIELQQTENLMQLDWRPLIPMLQDKSMSVNKRASLFHASLAHGLLKQAQWIREHHAINTVCLSGGVFQNRILTEQTVCLLLDQQFTVHVPERLPINDAGISFGQIIEHYYQQQSN